MVQIYSAFEYCFYSWSLYYDMIVAVPIIYFFHQIAAVKNFWVAVRVKKKAGHWKCISSVKNLNPLRLIKELKYCVFRCEMK